MRTGADLAGLDSTARRARAAGGRLREAGGQAGRIGERLAGACGETGLRDVGDDLAHVLRLVGGHGERLASEADLQGWLLQVADGGPR